MQSTFALAGAILASAHIAACSTDRMPPTHAQDGAALGNSSFTPMGAMASDDRVSEEFDPSEVTFETRTWVWRDTTGLIIASPNYDIHTTIEDPRLLDILPGFFESALRAYRTSLAALPAPSDRFETYIFKDRQQWRHKTWEVLPKQAGAFMNLGRGGFATRGIAVLYFIDYRAGNPHDTLAIAAHEGWHQYTQKTFRHQLPVWLEEGIATYMEGFQTTPEGITFTPEFNRERRRELSSAVRHDRLIPLGELMSKTPQEFLTSGKDHLLTYYAQVWALTRFLVEYEDGKYASTLTEVLTDAAEGRLMGRIMSAEARHTTTSAWANFDARTGPWLVQAYFNDDMMTFRQEYEAFILELVRPRSELRTPGRG
jgi:hypothetical protein